MSERREMGATPGETHGGEMERCGTCGKEIREGEHALRLGVFGSDGAPTGYHQGCIPPTVTSSGPCEKCGKVHVELTPDCSPRPGVCYACKKEIPIGDSSFTLVSPQRNLTMHNSCAKAVFEKMASQGP